MPMAEFLLSSTLPTVKSTTLLPNEEPDLSLLGDLADI